MATRFIDVQKNTLRIFTVLRELRAQWGRSLIVSCGASAAGAEMALAANIAGAACLCLDRSSEACRAAMRGGAVDFVVNTLDEALRILKNEIRKGQPVSVALERDPSAALDELLERGVLPRLFTVPAHELQAAEMARYSSAAETWHALGALVLDFGPLRDLPFAIDVEARFTAAIAARRWALESFDFDSSGALRSFEERLRERIPEDDPRRPWIAAASRHFHRNRAAGESPYQRVLLLTEAESARLR
jgi:hypothetical protein